MVLHILLVGLPKLGVFLDGLRPDEFPPGFADDVFRGRSRFLQKPFGRGRKAEVRSLFPKMIGCRFDNVSESRFAFSEGFLGPLAFGNINKRGLCHRFAFPSDDTEAAFQKDF